VPSRILGRNCFPNFTIEKNNAAIGLENTQLSNKIEVQTDYIYQDKQCNLDRNEPNRWGAESPARVRTRNIRRGLGAALRDGATTVVANARVTGEGGGRGRPWDRWSEGGGRVALTSSAMRRASSSERGALGRPRHGARAPRARAIFFPDELWGGIGLTEIGSFQI